MPAIGAGNADIRSICGIVLNVIKSKVNHICSATCDGLVLRMHYRWTFFLLLGTFLTVWYSWYHREIITCVSHFNADAQVRLDYLNICLSYPFIVEKGEKRYLLFYRWIAWAFSFLASVYYIPRKVSKNLDNAKCKKLLEDLAANAHRYDQAERELVDRAAGYMIFNIKTHNGLYWKFLTVNIIALLVDIFAMQFLDFLLQGRFIQYGYNSYPFSRDPHNFTDYMSKTFPPFASCEIAKQHQLLSKRTEMFGCHLTIMELYEKLFLGLWVWIITLTFVTCCYIIFLFLMWLPYVQVYLLRVAKPVHASDKVRGVVHAVTQNCKIGDIYLLYRLKGHLSHVRFYELMVRLSDPNLCNKQIQQSGPNKQIQQSGPNKQIQQSGPGVMPENKQADILRQRQPNMPQNPPVNQEYLHQLLAGNPEMMGRHPQHPDNALHYAKKAQAFPANNQTR
ncbi:innexin inx2-like [Homarus americanus]|uniref:Innexin n=1 Tax=Homarus americanus TaxID=6706 RepID=A0A8J5K245_HOMAM|nr:innexin inx2-like [Homarus americanus]KAG7166094.1 Innexin inx2-like 7 [Homarus americanus]